MHADTWTWVLTLTVLAVGVGASLWAARHAARSRHDKALERFKGLTAEIIEETEHRIADFSTALSGVRGLYASKKLVERAEFQTYARMARTEEWLKGTMGLGFIQRVPRADLNAFLASVRADGAPDFHVRRSLGIVTPIGKPLPPEEPADDLYIIKYIEPLERNRPAWGFDIGSDPVRREAADQAMLTDEPTLSAPITLVQDGRKRERAGFLYLMPVYKNGTNPVTPEERRAALVGWVYVPLVIDEVLAEVEKETVDGLVTLEIYEDRARGATTGATPAPADLVYDRDGVPQALDPADAAERMFHRWSAARVGGRDWLMWLATQPAFDAESRGSSAPALLGAGGTTVSILLATVVLVMGTGQTRAMGLATEMARTLRRSVEARYKAIFNGSLEGIKRVDANCRILDMNPACMAQFEADSAEALRGRSVLDLVAPEHREQYRRDVAEVVAGRGPVTREFEIIGLCGGRRWLQECWVLLPDRSDPSRDGEVLAMNRDVTERRKAELQVLERERRFRTLVEGARVIVWESDPRTRTFTYVSPHAAALGYPLEEWYTPDFWANHVHPDDRERAVAFSRTESAAGRGRRFEYRMLTADGRTAWIEDYLTVERLEDGTWIERGVLVDITAIKRADELARAAAVREVAAAVAAGVAHEFNSLLFATSLAIKQCLPASLDVEGAQGRLARQLIREAQSLAGSLLDLYYHIDEAKPRPHSFYPWLPETVSRLTKSVPSSIRVTTEVEFDLPEAMAHPLGLEQVLRNLLFNAVNVLGEAGEVRVSASLAVVEGREMVEIRISDDGPGVPEELRKRIFEPGFSTRLRSHRSGLGLAIAVHMLEQFDGTISYEAGMPRGSTFVIRLPACRGEDQ